MTITKEIPVKQMEDLDLHPGDSLQVVAETDASLLIQIVKAVKLPSKAKRGSAGAWARKYTGAARFNEGESTDDVRLAHLQAKYGV